MITLYAAIEKIDREQRMVFGYASTEALDQQGEIVRLEALEAALPEYMRFANIREMHQPSAVGVAHEAAVDGKGLWLGARVVDERAWEKVKAGVYKGFSIGGSVTARDPQNRMIITGVDLTEISLVDRPANPEAVFEMVKRAEGALGPQPRARWDCGVAAHRHFAQADAARCMEQQMSVNGAATKRDYSAAERQAMAESGEALPDGSFPIKDRADLAAAIHDCGRAKDPAKARAHIIARAEALDATDLLPPDWHESSADQDAAAVGKIGARHSAVDLARIQAIHDHAVDLGAACAGHAKSATAADLRKAYAERNEAAEALEKLASQVTPLLAELSELKKRLAIVEATPLPPRAVLGAVAVSKEDDRAGIAAERLATRLAAVPPGAARANEILRHAYYTPHLGSR
ncbi:MAG TPA: XkdF-like putative serine protease domain-containing protein [Stellaceae bacterium]|nr:XkdF-like putative serine protease domain-containing protein [Stellaceae bacterium]